MSEQKPIPAARLIVSRGKTFSESHFAENGAISLQLQSVAASKSCVWSSSRPDTERARVEASIVGGGVFEVEVENLARRVVSVGKNDEEANPRRDGWSPLCCCSSLGDPLESRRLLRAVDTAVDEEDKSRQQRPRAREERRRSAGEAIAIERKNEKRRKGKTFSSKQTSTVRRRPLSIGRERPLSPPFPSPWLGLCRPRAARRFLAVFLLARPELRSQGSRRSERRGGEMIVEFALIELGARRRRRDLDRLLRRRQARPRPPATALALDRRALLLGIAHLRRRWGSFGRFLARRRQGRSRCVAVDPGRRAESLRRRRGGNRNRSRKRRNPAAKKEATLVGLRLGPGLAPPGPWPPRPPGGLLRSYRGIFERQRGAVGQRWGTELG